MTSVSVTDFDTGNFGTGTCLSANGVNQELADLVVLIDVECAPRPSFSSILAIPPTYEKQAPFSVTAPQKSEEACEHVPISIA